MKLYRKIRSTLSDYSVYIFLIGILSIPFWYPPLLQIGLEWLMSAITGNIYNLELLKYGVTIIYSVGFAYIGIKEFVSQKSVAIRIFSVIFVVGSLIPLFLL